MKTTTNDAADCALLFSRCEALVGLMQAGKVNFDEFAYNFTMRVIEDSPFCWDHCLGLIRDELRKQFADYLRTFLQPVDFKPCPKVFMVPPFTEDAIEAKKVELQPRYIDLYERVRSWNKDC